MSKICDHGINLDNMSCWTCSLATKETPIEVISEPIRPEINTQTEIKNEMGSFMERSLDTFSFIQNNNSQNIWENSLINSTSISSSNNSNIEDNIHLGMITRKPKKNEFNAKNEDLHLKRSILNTNFMHGNRFYEIKPTNSRRHNYRDIGNEHIRQNQSETKELLKQNKYGDAYNKI